MATVEEIEKQYAVAIERAGSDYKTVAQLKVEKAEALAALRLQALEERERAVWQRDALHDFPLAREFGDQVKGETEAEVRDAAKRLHERLENLFADYEKTRKREVLIQAQLEAEQNPPKEEDDAGAAVQ